MRLSFTLTLAALFCACGGGSEWRRDWELGERALSHGRLSEAEPALEAALASAEMLRPGEARSGREERLASSLNALGDLRMAQGAPARAEPLYRRALAILEKSSGPDSLETAAAVAYLA